jgi:hypothetical protein
MAPLLWLLLWFVGMQTRQEPPQARGSIQGRVIRSGLIATGLPTDGLGQARVEIKPGNITFTTSAGGTFLFRNLPTGQYTISVTRDGYVLQEDPKRGITAYGMTINVGGGQELKDLVIPMVPAPVIAGRVFDPGGDPSPAALVRAYVRQYTAIGTRMKNVKKAMTDDMGEFRLSGLTFGQYFISAGYSDRDRQTAIGTTLLSPNISKADDGYPTLFYDGGEDISRASPVRLVAGADNGSLEFYLKEGPRFRIRGQVIPPVRGVRILFAPKGSDLSNAEYSVEPNAAGVFEVRSVSPGVYLLLATDNDLLSSEVITVNVTDSDIDGVRLGLSKTIKELPGAIAWEGAPRGDPSRMRVKLTRSTIEFDQKFEAKVAADGTFTLEKVPLAQYDITVEPLPSGVYVKSIISGNRSVLEGNARILDGDKMRIVLTTATDCLRVQTLKGSNPAPRAEIVLIPTPQLRRRADRYIVGFSDAFGNAVLEAVPPLNYTAYAFEEIEPGAYYLLGYNSPAIDRFSDRSAPATVDPKCVLPLQLRMIPATETVGGLQ